MIIVYIINVKISSTREFVVEMLQNSEEGSFFVRDSQSRPGCFALTMRVPKEANPSGFGNFLIVKVKDGVMIQVKSVCCS